MHFFLEEHLASLLYYVPSFYPTGLMGCPGGQIYLWVRQSPTSRTRLRAKSSTSRKSSDLRAAASPSQTSIIEVRPHSSTSWCRWTAGEISFVESSSSAAPILTSVHKNRPFLSHRTILQYRCRIHVVAWIGCQRPPGMR